MHTHLDQVRTPVFVPIGGPPHLAKPWIFFKRTLSRNQSKTKETMKGISRPGALICWCSWAKTSMELREGLGKLQKRRHHKAERLSWEVGKPIGRGQGFFGRVFFVGFWFLIVYFFVLNVLHFLHSFCACKLIEASGPLPFFGAQWEGKKHLIISDEDDLWKRMFLLNFESNMIAL